MILWDKSVLACVCVRKTHMNFRLLPSSMPSPESARSNPYAPNWVYDASRRLCAAIKKRHTVSRPNGHHATQEHLLVDGNLQDSLNLLDARMIFQDMNEPLGCRALPRGSRLPPAAQRSTKFSSSSTKCSSSASTHRTARALFDEKLTGAVLAPRRASASSLRAATSSASTPIGTKRNMAAERKWRHSPMKACKHLVQTLAHTSNHVSANANACCSFSSQSVWSIMRCVSLSLLYRKLMSSCSSFTCVSLHLVFLSFLSSSTVFVPVCSQQRVGVSRARLPASLFKHISMGQVFHPPTQRTTLWV